MPDELDIEDQIANGDSDDNQAPSSTADIIRDFNQNQGKDPDASAGGSQADPPADPVDSKQTPPAATTTDPKKPQGTQQQSSTTPTDPATPADPEWADRNKSQQNKPTPGSQTDPGKKTDTPGDNTTGGADPAVAQQAYSRLSELTDGNIKSEQDFLGLIERYNDLVTQAEEGFKPKFKNDAHRHAFELLAAASEGQELETARRTLHTLSLDTSKLKGKELLFEGFLLDPENSDLTREKAWELFDEYFDKKYSNASEDKLLARDLQKEERKAKEMIDKLQGDFKKTSAQDSEEPQVDPKVMASVKRAVDEFGGISMAFAENPTDADYFNIAVDGQEELDRLNRYVLNPQEYWKDLIKSHTSDQGFDYPGFVRTMYEMANIQKVKRVIYDQAYERGKLAHLNKDTNSTPPAERVKTGARVPAGPKKEAGSFYEAFDNALNGK